MTKRVDDTKATQFSGVARWRENTESTQLPGFARWMGKKYSYLLGCTHITLKIPTILPYPSSIHETRERTPIVVLGTIFTTKNRNDKQDMRNHQADVKQQKGKRSRNCDAVWEEHTKEIRNHIETRQRRIWHTGPLKVYKEPPCPSYVHQEWQPPSVPFISLCTLRPGPNIAISTITNDHHAVYINQQHCSSTQQCHGFWSVLNLYHCRYNPRLHPCGSHHHHSHHYRSPRHHHSLHPCSHHHCCLYLYPLLGYLYYH